MTSVEPVVSTKKLKIKISSKRIEAVSETRPCEPVKQLPLVNKGSYNSSVDDYYHAKKNSTASVANKRGPSWILEGHKDKRQKMDRSASQQCSNLVKELIKHKGGWIFASPVDPVKLKIPDYFSIISNPMDLGTIKSKLEKNLYACAEEVAADVRLTFSNAMLYNPPTNDVHTYAKILNNYFETRWKSLEEKWNLGRSTCGSETTKEVSDPRRNCPKMPPLHATVSPKKLKPSEKKVKLTKSAVNGVHKSLEQVFPKGTGRLTCGSVITKQIPVQVTCKCAACGRSACCCGHASDSTHASSDISSERSAGGDHGACSTHAPELDWQAKAMLTSQMSKSDPDSDGAVSALYDGNICPSSQHASPTTDAISGDGWHLSFDVQLSPTKALRAAMLKQRFADTILKAQHKTLLDHGDNTDPVKIQQEKEKLEKRQREEKARIEAQLRAAEAASRRREEMELKRQREREREAARIAVQKMEKTVEIEESREIIKELERLCGGSLLYISRIDSKRAGAYKGCVGGARFGSPLQELGLFMKDDIVDFDDDVLCAGGEEGEIL